MKRFSLLALLALLTSCATTSAASTLTPEQQSRWSQCEATVQQWCHDHAHGDPEQEIQCRRDSRRDYAAITVEAERTRFLRDHGCAQ